MLLEAAAASGNPEGLEKLGNMYLRGEYVVADPEKALGYLARAIKGGRVGARSMATPC
jgi:TPR repeat protein